MLFQSGTRHARGGFKVHGLSVEFLKDKPLFAHKIEELIEFLGDAPLIAHNAMFDLSFLNAELERAKRKAVGRERLVDTLMLARRKHPGGSNRLDDLCLRYKIDNSKRVKHGALLDAELLAEVYIELIGARQTSLGLAADSIIAGEVRVTTIVVRERPQPLPSRVSAEEREAHTAFIAKLGRSRDLAKIRWGISWQDVEKLSLVIPGRAKGANPESRKAGKFYVSGFRARRFAASRNDGPDFSTAC